jgi:hypothetical protein
MCEIQVPKLRSHILKISSTTTSAITTTSAKLLLHDLVSSATAERKKPETELLV